MKVEESVEAGETAREFAAEPFSSCLTGAHLVSTGYSVADYSDKLPAQLGISLPPSVSGAVPKRKAEFVAGRICAARALGHFDPAIERHVGVGADRSPIWPAGFVGSITHAAGYAAALVARERDFTSLGIDSERIMDGKTVENVFGFVMNRAERDRIEKARSGDFSIEMLATAIFSAKESIYKCLYPLVGTVFDFRDVEIETLDPLSGDFSFRLKTDFGGNDSAPFAGRGEARFGSDFVHTCVALPSR